MMSINDWMDMCLEPCQQEIEIFDIESGNVVFRGYIDEMEGDDADLAECNIESWDITKEVICFNISL